MVISTTPDTPGHPPRSDQSCQTAPPSKCHVGYLHHFSAAGDVIQRTRSVESALFHDNCRLVRAPLGSARALPHLLATRQEGPPTLQVPARVQLPHPSAHKRHAESQLLNHFQSKRRIQIHHAFSFPQWAYFRAAVLA